MLNRLIPSTFSSLVGLHIQKNRILLIKLSQKKKNVIVNLAEMLDLPANSMIDKDIQSSEIVIQGIRELVERFHLQNQPTAIALPMQNIMSKEILPSQKITYCYQTAGIKENLSHYFPHASQELCFDYVTLPNQHYFLIATQQEQLNKTLHMVEQAGLSVKIIDVDMYALARAVKYIVSTEKKNMAILELNYNTAQFIILDQDIISYYVSFYYDESNDFYIQLHNSIQRYYSINSHFLLDTLYLVGDSVSTDIIDSIKNKLHLGFQYINPFHFLSTSHSIKKEKISLIANKMMVCLGLALRKAPAW